MNVMDAKEARVTKTGAHFVPTKEDLKNIRLLVPHSNKLISVRPPKPARKPPSRINFGLLSNPRLKMITAIPVEIERKGKTVTARWAAIEEFGYGRNISEALNDFGRTIEELYLSLHERREHLGTDLANVWTVLSRHIAVRSQRG